MYKYAWLSLHHYKFYSGVEISSHTCTPCLKQSIKLFIYPVVIKQNSLRLVVAGESHVNLNLASLTWTSFK